MMEKAIQLKVRKELNNQQQFNVIKLKGSLISSGYTEIIHIVDEDEEYHINSFETASGSKNEVHDFITAFITRENLEDTISILDKKFTDRLFTI
ncbi:hypothetical protein SAMN06265346_12065 [Flavobacterium hercynium]|nr:hypothetical protein SAMN06265346_12065 [Flavobacterium hercynium]